MTLIRIMVFVVICYQGLAWAEQSKLLDVNVKTLNDNKTVNLAKTYQGKIILVVNTASKCGFTPQYEGLEKLYKEYKKQGFVVLGFPSNDFGQQEPGDEKQIQKFCRLTYGVKFPMFSKTQVRKDNADELYRRLAGQAGEYPSWNFHKYLIDRNGKLVASFPSKMEPYDPRIISKLKSLL